MVEFLLVDDDKVSRRNLVRLFKRSGVQANIAQETDADSGVQRLKNEQFDIAFIDYRMPGCDGLEMLIQIQELISRGKVDVVMMIDRPDMAIQTDCLKAGATEVLVKRGMDSQELFGVINAVRARREMTEKRVDQTVVPISSGKDVLTQILSRTEFEHALRSVVGLKSSNKAAIMLLNINNFRNINELYGTEVGDKILQCTARRLRLLGEQMKCIARVGGDEFALLVDGFESAHELKSIASKLLSVIGKPIFVAEHQVQISASIGISTYPQDSKQEDELYKYSFIALYRAKQLGRNQVCFFKQEMQDAALRKHHIDLAINRGILAESFRMVFQPIYRLSSGELVGAEALMRWPNETPTYYPDEFIPVAETSGSIIALGKFAIKASLAQLAQWRAHVIDDFSISVNLSPRQLNDKSLPKFITQQLHAHNIPAKNLTLELTETALIEGAGQVSDVLKQLKSIGCQIALDDFGTGFSSISHLLNFPIDIVKIDKSVIPQQDNESKQHAVTKGLVMMLNQLGTSIVVEGVESAYQHEFMSSLKVDKVQGYFYGKPCTPEVFIDHYPHQRQWSDIG